MDTCCYVNNLLFVFIKVYTQNNTTESLVLLVTIAGNLEFLTFYWGKNICKVSLQKKKEKRKKKKKRKEKRKPLRL